MSRASWIVFLVFLSIALLAQSAPPASASLPSTVTFTLDYPQLDVPHYRIVLDSTGHGQYIAKSAGPQASSDQGAAGKNKWGGTKEDSGASAEQSSPAASSSQESYSRSFQLGPGVRDRIFALAKDSNYFRGDFEFHKHKVAFAGTKTLAYSGQGIEGSASFNYSQNPSVSKLSDMFQGIALDLQAEARLRRLLRYDRLGLNQELATLEQRSRDAGLVAPQLLSAVLRDIVNDRSVMELARRRAQHLLDLASAEAK